MRKKTNVKKKRMFTVTYNDMNYSINAYDRNDVISQLSKMLDIRTRKFNGKLKVYVENPYKRDTTYYVIRENKKTIFKGSFKEVAEKFNLNEKTFKQLQYYCNSRNDYFMRYSTRYGTAFNYIIVDSNKRLDIMKKKNFKDKMKWQKNYIHNMRLPTFQGLINSNEFIETTKDLNIYLSDFGLMLGDKVDNMIEVIDLKSENVVMYMTNGVLQEGFEFHPFDLKMTHNHSIKYLIEKAKEVND